MAAIAGVNSVSRALTEGISEEGRTILGGDLAFSLIQREASAEERQFFRSKGEVGVIATSRAMARRADESNQTLVELKAVDAAYPHGGTLVLEDGSTDTAERDGSRRTAFSERSPRRSCSTGFGISRGRPGSCSARRRSSVRGAIRTEPDLLSSGIGFGPRLIIPRRRPATRQDWCGREA